MSAVVALGWVILGVWLGCAAALAIGARIECRRANAEADEAEQRPLTSFANVFADDCSDPRCVVHNHALPVDPLDARYVTYLRTVR